MLNDDVKGLSELLKSASATDLVYERKYVRSFQDMNSVVDFVLLLCICVIYFYVSFVIITARR